MPDLLKETIQTVLVPKGTAMYQTVAGVSKRRLELASTCRFAVVSDSSLLKLVNVRIGNERFSILNAVIENGVINQTHKL